MVQVSATSRGLVHHSGFRPTIRPRHNKAARRRLCADYRRPVTSSTAPMQKRSWWRQLLRSPASWW